MNDVEVKKYFSDDPDRAAVLRCSEKTLAIFDILPNQCYSIAGNEWKMKQQQKMKMQGYLPWSWRLRDTWSYDEYDKGGPHTYVGFVDKEGGVHRHYYRDVRLRPAMWVRVEK